MKVCVFGASGGVGREIVNQALERGFAVKAVYRTPIQLSRNENLETVTLPDLIHEVHGQNLPPRRI